MRLSILALLPIPVLALVLPIAAHADPRTDCPDVKPCKVLTLTAEEEQALLGPKMVLETAVTARQIDLIGVATYFRDKLRAAPAGDAPKAPEKAPTDSSVAK